MAVPCDSRAHGFRHAERDTASAAIVVPVDCWAW